MGSDSIPDWKDVCRQSAETVGCAMAYGTTCGDVRKSELRADEVSAEGVRLVGARSASLLAERADGCTSDMEVGEACSVRKNAGEPCARANYQPLQQLQVLAQNTKDAKPRIHAKA